jgi:hypothetical protein
MSYPEHPDRGKHRIRSAGGRSGTWWQTPTAGRNDTTDLSLPVVEDAGLRLHHRREEIAVAVFILTPVLKEPEDGINTIFGMGLQMAINGDIPPVANFSDKVGGVEDELGLEEGVLLALGQKAQVKLQVEVRHGLIQKASVTSFVPRHEIKAFGQYRDFYL